MKKIVLMLMGISGLLFAEIDVWTHLMEEKGLFKPHANNCDASTEAFVAIGDGSVGYCIDKKPRRNKYWADARQTCLAEGKRLPEVAEWQIACKNAGSLKFSYGSWEWVSNFSSITDDITKGSYIIVPVMYQCYASYLAPIAQRQGYANSYQFRCVH